MLPPRHDLLSLRDKLGLPQQSSSVTQEHTQGLVKSVFGDGHLQATLGSPETSLWLLSGSSRGEAYSTVPGGFFFPVVML